MKWWHWLLIVLVVGLLVATIFVGAKFGPKMLESVSESSLTQTAKQTCDVGPYFIQEGGFAQYDGQETVCIDGKIVVIPDEVFVHMCKLPHDKAESVGFLAVSPNFEGDSDEVLDFEGKTIKEGTFFWSPDQSWAVNVDGRLVEIPTEVFERECGDDTPTPTPPPTEPPNQMATQPASQTPPPTANPSSTPATETPTTGEEPQPISSFPFKYRGNGDWGDQGMVTIVVFTNDMGTITGVTGVDAGLSFDIEGDTQGWVYLFSKKDEAVAFANLRGVDVPRYWVGDRPNGYSAPPDSWTIWEFPPDEEIYPGGEWSDWTISLDSVNRKIETDENEWVYCQTWNPVSGEIYHFVVVPSEKVEVPGGLQGTCWASVNSDDQKFLDRANQATVWAVDRDDINKFKLHRLVFGDVGDLKIPEGWEVLTTPSFP